MSSPYAMSAEPSNDPLLQDHHAAGSLDDTVVRGEGLTLRNTPW
jgi:hypothetical protein